MIKELNHDPLSINQVVPNLALVNSRHLNIWTLYIAYRVTTRFLIVFIQGRKASDFQLWVYFSTASSPYPLIGWCTLSFDDDVIMTSWFSLSKFLYKCNVLATIHRLRYLTNHWSIVCVIMYSCAHQIQMFVETSEIWYSLCLNCWGYGWSDPHFTVWPSLTLTDPYLSRTKPLGKRCLTPNFWNNSSTGLLAILWTNNLTLRRITLSISKSHLGIRCL